MSFAGEFHELNELLVQQPTGRAVYHSDLRQDYKESQDDIQATSIIAEDIRLGEYLR